MINQGKFAVVDQRTGYWVVFAVITAVLLGVALGLPAWMTRQLAAPPVAASTVFRAYDASGAYQQTEDWKAAQAAYQTWLASNPQPKNAQVLTGMDTGAIYGYMVSQVSGGLKVSCQYCHNINDYSSDEKPQKVKARAMMAMSADLNGNFVSRLPASVGGYQVTCATCHNGKPQFETYPVKIQNTLPNDFKIPMDRYYPGGLTVNGKRTIGLEEVELNQYTMYHFNVSLGQGCTFCHNARYFPSNEIEQKAHALTMLQMVRSMYDQYVAPGGKLSDGIMNGKTPSCWMCHQGARVPPAAAQPGQVPAVLTQPIAQTK